MVTISQLKRGIREQRNFVHNTSISWMSAKTRNYPSFDTIKPKNPTPPREKQLR
jgi:hypothetical protein